MGITIGKTKYCEEHQKHISSANWARHQQRYHPHLIIKPEVSGAQEWCEQHGWISRSQRRRHYVRLHNGVVPARPRQPVGSRRGGRRQTTTHTAGEEGEDLEDEDEDDEDEKVEDDDVTPDTPMQDTDDDAVEAADRYMIEQHLSATAAAVKKTREQVEQQLAQLPGGPLSRLGRELPLYQRELRRLVPGEPITFDEYTHAGCGGDAADISPRHKYVVCSTGDARKILEAGNLTIPVLVPASDRDSSTMQIPDYLTYLSTKPDIDVHTYDQPVDDDGDYLKPLVLSSADAIARFQDLRSGPVNFLNLEAHKQNEIPSCIVDLPAYNILRDLREDNQSGKRRENQPFDLSACASFQICGKRGVFSLAHIDHHEVLTTAFGEQGEKLWMTWPGLTDAEFERWATSEDVAPEPAPFPLYLRRGDLLIQPPRRVHSPYSMTDVLMTGTMHWDSRRMLPVLRQSLYERRHPKVTNEDPAKEFDLKLESIERLWRLRHPAWPWGTTEEWVEFSGLLREWKAGSGDSRPGCNCRTGCVRNTCGCLKAKTPCGPSCHAGQGARSTRRGKACQNMASST